MSDGRTDVHTQRKIDLYYPEACRKFAIPLTPVDQFTLTAWEVIREAWNPRVTKYVRTYHSNTPALKVPGFDNIHPGSKYPAYKDEWANYVHGGLTGRTTGWYGLLQWLGEPDVHSDEVSALQSLRDLREDYARHQSTGADKYALLMKVTDQHLQVAVAAGRPIQ